MRRTTSDPATTVEIAPGLFSVLKTHPFGIAGAIVLGLLAYLGWREFWFLTDDAFITFRYCANHLRGWGYTWNPPPFRPVEGYSNFLWAALLETIWALTGIDPPRAANPTGFLCGLGTLAIAMRIAWRAAVPSAMAAHRLALCFFVAFATLTNTTFLTWMSSGLETPLFVLGIMLWLDAILAKPHPKLLYLGIASSLLAMTRPDGYLFAVAGVFVTLVTIGPTLVCEVRIRGLLPLVPYSIPLAHALWRRGYYGEWVPNTYYAKHVGAWPESGAHYAASFVLEYGLWGLALVLLGAILAWWTKPERKFVLPRLSAIAALVTLAAHAGYFTFVIGGDHFEYRVYSHLVAIFWLCALWSVLCLTARPTRVWLALTGLLALSLPVQWAHHLHLRRVTDRQQAFQLFLPMAPSFPRGMRPYLELFDTHQAWLIKHFVGIRRQEHKVFYDSLVSYFPVRSETPMPLDEGNIPVVAYQSVGVAGWTLPNVAIVDVFGLNDRVIARTPRQPGGERMMAHDRTPPSGYVECFLPNVEVRDQVVIVHPRALPLSPQRVQDCEERFEKLVRQRVRP